MLSSGGMRKALAERAAQRKPGDLEWHYARRPVPQVRNKPPRDDTRGAEEDDLAWLRDPGWVKQLLENPGTRQYAEGRLFQRFDRNRNDQLDLWEARALCGELCTALGLHTMNEDSVQKLVDSCDVSETNGLTREEFHRFFGTLLRNVQRNSPQVLANRRTTLFTFLEPYLAKDDAEAQDIALRLVSPPEDSMNIAVMLDEGKKVMDGYGATEGQLDRGDQVAVVVKVTWDETCTDREYRWWPDRHDDLDYTGTTRDNVVNQSMRVLFDKLPFPAGGASLVACCVMHKVRELQQLVLLEEN